MKKCLIALGLVFGLTPVWFALDNDNQAIAISGCCKTRVSQKDPWKKTDSDLESCKVENESDGDHLFKKSGVAWWDTAC